MNYIEKTFECAGTTMTAKIRPMTRRMVKTLAEQGIVFGTPLTPEQNVFVNDFIRDNCVAKETLEALDDLPAGLEITLVTAIINMSFSISEQAAKN